MLIRFGSMKFLLGSLLIEAKANFFTIFLMVTFFVTDEFRESLSILLLEAENTRCYYCTFIRVVGGIEHFLVLKLLGEKFNDFASSSFFYPNFC